WYPDIMHAHDWSAGLVPVILKHLCRREEAFKNTASIYTIHNMGYQGKYSKNNYPDLGLPWDLYHGANFEQYGDINLMQAAIASADMITTVSPTYAKEIQTPEGGFGLDGLLRVRSDRIRGIVNGVDTKIWNPQTDPYLPENYSVTSLEGKAACKRELQETMGFEINPDIPVIGIVTRLADQKGIGPLFGPNYGCMYTLCMKLKVQVALLGSGEKWCENEIRSLQSRLPNFKAVLCYKEDLSHLIEAGSDFFLMPSKYEPCGLNQMYSLLYGTLPIVRRTGGLADTVENYNEKTGDGTGFMLDNLTPSAVFNTVGWALYAYYNKKEHIKKMQKKAMKSNFSWDTSANNYVQIYKTALRYGCGREI
ncbi:MAG: glycogen synthase, partial [Treponema sp.]|nr:glycogen synthase [Treponema sp.]